jgi:hypothetical protein
VKTTKDEYGRPCVAVGNANEELSATIMPNQDDNQRVIRTLANQIIGHMYDAKTIDNLKRQKALFMLCEDLCDAGQSYINNVK